MIILQRWNLQLIFNGDAFNQILSFHYSYGEDNDQYILNNPEEEKRFIENKRQNYARILGIDEDDLIFSKLREGGINNNMAIKNSNSGITMEKIYELKKYEESVGAKFIGVNKKCLLFLASVRKCSIIFVIN